MPNEVEQRLREIEERANRATPGPWEAYGVGGIHMDGTSDGYSLMTARGRRLHSPYMTQADATFCAYAREDVPWLLSLLRERDEENRRLREVLDWLVHLNHGVSRGGGAPSMVEWEDAWQNAERMIGLKEV